MKINFKKFNYNYYNQVCDFLIEISKNSSKHINWNWARCEWMFFHPEFNRNLIDEIGIWFLGENLIALATYDHYLGEGIFLTKEGFEYLENELLEYVIENFSDNSGVGIAVNDKDIKTINMLKSHNFIINNQTENILELKLDKINFNLKSIDDVILESLNIENDLFKHHELLWKGFNHIGPAPLDNDTINKQKIMLSAPNLNPFLHVIAKTTSGEYISYCGLWFNKETDYVYIEPVCTIPGYRNKGIGKMVIIEALRRASSLGAKKAYVISDNNFYKSLGFMQHSHYTFYWYKK